MRKWERHRTEAEGRGQTTEGEGQKKEDPSSLSELRRGTQRAEDRILNAEVGMRKSERGTGLSDED